MALSLRSIGARWALLAGCLGPFALPAPAQAPAPGPAQGVALLNKSLAPPSPEAAALGRFGDVPVSLYTGVPSVSIPIHTLQGRGCSVPVSLQYHGGGVRLDEVSTWVGMSWSLEAGGVITREMHGADDFQYTTAWGTAASFPYPFDGFCYEQNTPNPYFNFLKGTLSGEVDSQPDVFSFSLPGGQSGKIMFDLGKQHVYVSPGQDLRVDRPIPGNGYTWVLTTADGTRHEFGTAGQEKSTRAGGLSGTGISAWYLTRLTTLAGDTVRFTYGTYRATIAYPINSGNYTALASQSKYLSAGSSTKCSSTQLPTFSTRPYTTLYAGKYLARIDHGPYRVRFVSSANRPDLAVPGQFNESRRLNRILIQYLPDTTRYREFVLGQSTEHQRLWLKTVQERGVEPAGAVERPPYRMGYILPGGNVIPDNGSNFNPYRGSYDVDRWGFYNGRSNSVPWPAFSRGTLVGGAPDNEYAGEGADRRSHPTAVQFGLLRRIVYPTGGWSEFTFEPHDYGNIMPRPVYDYTATPFDFCTSMSNSPPQNCSSPTSTSPSLTLGEEQDLQVDITVRSLGSGVPASARNCWEVTLQRVKTDGSGGYENYRVWRREQTNACMPTPNNTAPCGTGDSQSLALLLDPGTYRFVVGSSCTTDANYQVFISLTYGVNNLIGTIYKAQGGGVRIKRVVSRAAAAATPQVTEYRYGSDSLHSTGRLTTVPLFHKITVEPTVFIEHNAKTHYACKYLVSSGSDLITRTGLGSIATVGYDSVTVLKYDGATVVKSVSAFRNVAATVGVLNDKLVAPDGALQPSDFAEANGQLLYTADYRVREGGDPLQPTDCHLVQRTAYQYDNDRDADLVRSFAVSGSLGNAEETDVMLGVSRTNVCQWVYSGSHLIPVQWRPQTGVTTTRVDAAGHAFTTATRTAYDSPWHKQATLQEASAGPGRTKLTRLKYAPDYASTAGAVGLLQQAYLVGTPVEQQQWVHDPSAGPDRWLGGTVTTYAAPGYGLLRPDRIYQAELPAPVTSLPQAQDADGRYVDAVPTPAYKQRAVLHHTPAGQLASQRLLGDVATSYVWGYYGTQPIAEAGGTDANRVAYTSFEPGSAGGWGYDPGGHRVAGGRTGRWAYRLDGGWGVGVAAGSLPAGDYELLFWAQAEPAVYANGSLADAVTLEKRVVATAPGGWQQYRRRLRLPAGSGLNIDASSGTPILLDEVRLAPVGAPLKTYTYDPLNGVTSVSDATGRLTTFEYDALGRLLRARDEQGRLLKEHEYRYLEIQP